MNNGQLRLWPLSGPVRWHKVELNKQNRQVEGEMGFEAKERTGSYDDSSRA
jgi:hypothetical protein